METVVYVKKAIMDINVKRNVLQTVKRNVKNQMANVYADLEHLV